MNTFRLSLRSLARSPGFASISILTLALGIGLNTAMFSLIDTFLLQPLKYTHSEKLFLLQRTSPKERNGEHSPANFIDLRRDCGDFADIAAFRGWGLTFSQPNRPAEMLQAHRVSSGYFEILQVQPELGRLFRPDEDQVGRNHVIILSHAFWVSHFAADPKVIGQVVRVEGTPHEIVGVLPLKAAAPIFGPVQIFRPLALRDDERVERADPTLGILGRYRGTVTADLASARFATLASRLAADFPKENAEKGFRVVPLGRSGMGDIGRNITFMLLALSGFVLLIACANLANLLLARAIARVREFAIRAALGASRIQLIKPLVAESILLAIAGAVLGMFISWATTSWMAVRLRGDGPPLEFAYDWRVMIFALAASLFTGLFFGVLPAWLTSRIRISDTLKAGGRGSTGAKSHQRFRQILIVFQFALALVLLTGATLFVGGIHRLMRQEVGWDPAPLVRGTISLPEGTYPSGDDKTRLYDKVLQRLAALPGVEKASVSYELPVFRFPVTHGYIVEGREPPLPGHEATAFVNGVCPDYFATVGTRLLSGRLFTTADRGTSPHVVIINATMAHTLFPQGDAIGHRLARVGEQKPQWSEIVGIAEDVEFLNIAPPPIKFQLYQPIAEEPWGYVTLSIRVAKGAAGLIEPFRRAVAEADPDMPVLELFPVPSYIEHNMDDFKLINQLLIGFALLGLFLAALGIYGVITRLVLQRTGEIGVRMALGAQASNINRLILGAGLRLTLMGAVFGSLGAVGVTRFLAATMPALASGSFIGIVGAVLVLGAVALLACYLPARRASRIDPIIALRAE